MLKAQNKILKTKIILGLFWQGSRIWVNDLKTLTHIGKSRKQNSKLGYTPSVIYGNKIHSNYPKES